MNRLIGYLLYRLGFANRTKEFKFEETNIKGIVRIKHYFEYKWRK